MAIIDDTNPQLGGNLDLNNFNILGTGSVNIIGSGNYSQGLYVNSTGVSLTGHTHPESVQSNINGLTGGNTVSNIIVLSQANYDLIESKNPNTLYFIN